MNARLCGAVFLVGLLGVGSLRAVPLPERHERMTFGAFQPGRPPFYQVVESTTEQTMTVQRQEVTQKQESTFVLHWTPLEKDREGNYRARMKVVGVKLNVDMSGNTIRYDSSEPAAKKPSPYAVLLGATFTCVASPEGRIVTFEGRTKQIEKLGQTNPQMYAVLAHHYSKKALTQLVKPLWNGLPPRRVEKGDDWASRETLDAVTAEAGSFRASHRFTHRGKVKDRLRIDVATQLDYQPPPAPKAGALPGLFIVNNVKLSAQASSVIYFNPDRGCMDETRATMRVEGELTMKVNRAAPVRIELRQEHTFTSRVLNRNPRVSRRACSPIVPASKLAG